MDTLQLIDKVHSYYSDSFTQLMYLTVSILVIIGVIMPFVLQSLQAKSFKSEKEAMEALIKGDIQNARIEMKSVIEKMFTKAGVAHPLGWDPHDFTPISTQHTSAALK